MRPWTSLGAPAVLAFAFAFRLAGLDRQSFWADEGATAVMAQRDAAAIWNNAALDIHPPLFYLLEAAWASGAGTSEYALRFLSVAFGVLTVVLAWRLVTWLFDERAGVAAALAVAIAPYLVQYSQEARMYAQLAALALLATALALRALGWPRRPSVQSPWLWPALTVVTLATLATQYYGAALLPALAITATVLVLLGLVTWHRWALLALSQVAALLLFLVWLVPAWSVISGWPSISEPFGPAELATRLLRIFSWGVGWEQNLTLPGTAVPLLLLGLGLITAWAWPVASTSLGVAIPPSWRERLARLAVILPALLLPPLLMFLVSLSRPSYNPKLLLAAVPWFAILLGLGIAGPALLAFSVSRGLVRPLAPIAATAVVVALVAAAWIPLTRAHTAYFDDPRYARDDYRGVVRTLADLAGPDDAVILNAPGQEEIVRYYAGDRFTLYPLPASRPQDPEATRAALASIAADHPRIWNVNWATEQSDPEGVIPAWLAANTYPGRETPFGTVRLVPAVVRAQPLATVPGPWSFAAADLDAVVLGSGDGRLAAGDTLTVDLDWQGTGPVEPGLAVFVQLLGPDGTLWGQRDAPLPALGPGVDVADRHALAIPWGTPPGTYSLLVGLYDPRTGQRIPLGDGGDTVAIPGITLDAAGRTPEGAGLRPDERFVLGVPGLDLVGVSLEALDGGGRTVRPGAELLVAQVWRRTPGDAAPLASRVVFACPGGETTVDREIRPPATPGDVVRAQQRVRLEGPPGECRVRLEAGGRQVDLGRVTLRP